MINRVVVLGGGSAGFLAAITLKMKLPGVSVELIRSPGIGIIGVGEGSTSNVTTFLHQYLKIDPKRFYDVVQPTWKLGLKFLWGPRPEFFFGFQTTSDRRIQGLSKWDGFYFEDDMRNENYTGALMANDRAFERQAGGAKFHNLFAYHFENEKLVSYLESLAANLGVTVFDDTVESVQQDESRITGLSLASGRVAGGDLFVDCSGFISLLLSKTLKEPYVSYKSTLFCERAVVGGWTRTDEVIKPYTTCETFDSGWCWQIEHETRINAGYVYCPAFISDADAEAELRRNKPKVGPTRIVNFTSGRYERAWVKNVVAIGNSAGFVEPLEATAIGVITLSCSVLASMLESSNGQPSQSQVNLYNRYHSAVWDTIRDFLAIHYRFNTRLDTPFWQHCQRETNLAGAVPIVEYYQENGPSPDWPVRPVLIPPESTFTQDGYFLLLLGQKVPFRKTFTPTAAELAIWRQEQERNRLMAAGALTARQMLDLIRRPDWRWHS